MKLDLEYIGNILDDYAIAISEYHALEKSEIADNDNSGVKNKLAVLLKKSHDKREDIDRYLNKVNRDPNIDSDHFLSQDIIESISSLYSILKNDIESIKRHNETNHALILLENQLQHLKYLVEKYSERIKR